MALNAFLKIDGIEGESTDNEHMAWIEIVSCKTGLNRKGSFASRGSGAGRANFDSVSVVKFLDKASPKLAIACASGKHIDNITIVTYRAGSDRVKHMEYKLSNCIISSVATAGGRGEFPSELMSIDFGKIQWIYVQKRNDGGGAAGQITACWDRQRNCKA